MKKYALLTLLLVSGSVMAQTSPQTPWLGKGEIQVGVGLGTNFGGYNGFSTRTAPYIQYFIKDRWAIRLEGQYDMYSFQGQKYLKDDLKRPQYLGAGIATQYHFLKTGRFSLYGQAGYSYGRYRVNIYDGTEPNATRTLTTNNGRFSLGVGAQYRLGDRWMLNALIERQSITNFNFKGGATSVQVSVGYRLTK